MRVGRLMPGADSVGRKLIIDLLEEVREGMKGWVADGIEKLQGRCDTRICKGLGMLAGSVSALAHIGDEAVTSRGRQWLARLNRGEILGELSTDLDPESVGVPFLISINELKVIAHGRSMLSPIWYLKCNR
jgi:fatty acid/phospholipid biosynthesis enzyme